MTSLKNNRRRLFIFTGALLLGLSLHAQIHISGKVVDSSSHHPLTSASVYFDGTTVGTQTDQNGAFELTLNKALKTSLVIEALGFKARKIKDLGLQKGNFDLKIIALPKKVESLNTVVLKPDSMTRKRKLAYFISAFLGKKHKSCRIENLEALKLSFDRQHKKLTAYASEPLKIVNERLGYIIRFNLSNFEEKLTYHPKTERRDFEYYTFKSVYYSGKSFFENMNDHPEDFSESRKEAYLGSSLHFMRALKNKALAENGFSIFKDGFLRPDYIYFDFTEIEAVTLIKLTTDKLHILYEVGHKSTLEALTDPTIFTIDEFGNYSPVNAILFRGDMGNKRVSSQLPLNYQPYNN